MDDRQFLVKILLLLLSCLTFCQGTGTLGMDSVTSTATLTFASSNTPYASSEIGLRHAYYYSKGTELAKPIVLACSVMSFTASFIVLTTYIAMSMNVRTKSLTSTITIRVAPMMAVADTIYVAGNLASYGTSLCSIWVWMYTFGSHASIFLANSVAIVLHRTFLDSGKKSNTLDNLSKDPTEATFGLTVIPILLASVLASLPLAQSMYIWRYDLKMCWWYGEDHPVPGAYARFQMWVWPTYYGPQLLCIIYGLVTVIRSTKAIRRIIRESSKAKNSFGSKSWANTNQGSESTSQISKFDNSKITQPDAKDLEQPAHHKDKKENVNVDANVDGERLKASRFFYRCILYPLIPLICNLPTLLSSYLDFPGFAGSIWTAITIITPACSGMLNLITFFYDSRVRRFLMQKIRNEAISIEKDD